MIFLGAGASKELGIKTMQELTEDIIRSLEKKGYSHQTREILSSLRKFRIKPDFEAIYSVLESLGNIKEGVKNAGPFTAYVCKNLKKINNIPNPDEILKELRLLIYEECLKIKRNRLNAIFDPLFTANFGLQTWHWSNVASRIVTTNYDMAIELYHWGKELPLTNGFNRTPNPFINVFSPDGIPVVDEPSFGNRRGKLLIKLHGAIWYFRQGSRLIETTNDPKDIPIDIEVGEQMMIYPTKEKPILKKPYYNFYRAFKEQVWNTLVVIGYSFRDAPVNTALLEQLKSASSPNIFVVDPNATETTRNFPNYRHYAKHFHNITLEFGKKGYENEFFSAITPYLNAKSL